MGPDGASGNLSCAISRSRTGIDEQLASCWLVHLSWTRLLRGIRRIDRLAPWLAWLPGKPGKPGSVARRLARWHGSMVHRADFGTCVHGETAVAGDQQAHVSKNPIWCRGGQFLCLLRFFFFYTLFFGLVVVGKAPTQAALQHGRPGSMEISVFTVRTDIGYHGNHSIFY